jgi:hypothetical protein
MVHLNMPSRDTSKQAVGKNIPSKLLLFRFPPLRFNVGHFTKMFLNICPYICAD